MRAVAMPVNIRFFQQMAVEQAATAASGTRMNGFHTTSLRRESTAFCSRVVCWEDGSEEE
jgi:hypothetical protein